MTADENDGALPGASCCGGGVWRVVLEDRMAAVDGCCWQGVKAVVEQREVVGLGWRVGTFLLESVEEQGQSRITGTALFEAYRRWCVEGDEIPLLEAVFFEEVGLLCEEAEIDVLQSGGNIAFLGVRLVMA
jgi:hypothetical protein